MGVLKGTNGSVKIDGTSFDVTSYSYEGSIDIVETTPVGSADKTFEQTTRGGSGSLAFVLDASSAQQKIIIDQLLTSSTLKKVLLQLYQDTSGTDQLYFSAVISSVSIPVGANDMDIVTCNYTKTGTLYHVPTT